MTILLDRHKKDFARTCPTCGGHRCASLENAKPGDEDRLLAFAERVWGKRPKTVFEGFLSREDAQTGKPARALMVQCPACQGSGFQMYVPKDDIKVVEK